MRVTRFPIRIGRRSALLVRVLFGATADRAWAEVREDTVAAQFGRWGLVIPLEAVVRWRIEGPWRWITAIGVRRSFRGGDMSFAGSPRGGVRMDFREPRRWGVLRVPALYVGVEDLEGFAAALAARGIPGEDARRRT